MLEIACIYAQQCSHMCDTSMWVGLTAFVLIKFLSCMGEMPKIEMGDPVQSAEKLQLWRVAVDEPGNGGHRMDLFIRFLWVHGESGNEKKHWET